MPSPRSQGTPVRPSGSEVSVAEHAASAPASMAGSSPRPTHIIKSRIKSSTSRRRDSSSEIDNSGLSDETTLVATPTEAKAVAESKDAQLMEPEGGYPLVCPICHVTPSNMKSHVTSAPHMSRLISLRSHYRTNPVVTARMDKFITWCIEEKLPIPDEIADLASNGAPITTPCRPLRPKARRDGFANSSEYATEQARRFSMADPFRGMYPAPDGHHKQTSTRGAPSIAEYQAAVQNAAQKYNMPPQGFVEGEGYSVKLEADNEDADADGEDEVPMYVANKKQQIDGSTVNVVDYQSGYSQPASTPAYKVQKLAAKFDAQGMVSATLVMTCGGFRTYGTSSNREPPQLKGLSLSGMGIFDAATPIQRRYRNQRKDASRVNEFLKRAKLVETIEKVYDMKFKFQRDRDVYDPPSPTGSPEPEDTSTRSKTPVKQSKKAKTEGAAVSPSTALLRLSEAENDLDAKDETNCGEDEDSSGQAIYMGQEDKSLMAATKSSPYLSSMVLNSPQRSMNHGVLPPLFSAGSSYGYSGSAADQAMMNSLTVGRSGSYGGQLHTSTQYGTYSQIGSYGVGSMMSSYPPVSSATGNGYGSGSGMSGYNYSTGGGSGSGSGSNSNSAKDNKEPEMSYFGSFSSYSYGPGSPKMGNSSRHL